MFASLLLYLSILETKNIYTEGINKIWFLFRIKNIIFLKLKVTYVVFRNWVNQFWGRNATVTLNNSMKMLIFFKQVVNFEYKVIKCSYLHKKVDFENSVICLDIVFEKKYLEFSNLCFST